MIQLHKLKIESEYARAKIRGAKPFEIRKNDRDYKVGDIIHYTVINDEYANQEMQNKLYRITYITSYMQKDGYVVFGDELATILDKEEYRIK